MFEATEPPEIVLFLGRFHPLLVHLPIGFLLIGFLLELFARFQRYSLYRHAVPFVLFLGALSSILAAGLGYLLSLGGGYDEELLALHQYTGIGMAVAAVIALYLSVRRAKMGAKLQKWLYSAALLLTVGLMAVAGHYGGSLTHGADYLTAYFPTSAESFTGGAATKGKKPAPIENLSEALVYTDIVQPIFENRCVSCHNPAKKKGELRLDDFSGLMAGGKGGAVVVAGEADKSELYKRLLLPPEDKYAMPPKGKEPLTESELQLIAWWIEEGGAGAEKKVKDLAQSSAVKAALANHTAVKEWENPVFNIEVENAPQEALVAAERAGFQVLPYAKDKPFVRVRMKMGAPAPERLSALKPLAEQLIALDLGGVPVSDSLLLDISTFTNLIRLHLENTQTTDAGVAHLANLTHLEYLNLYGNPITDNALQVLDNIPHLRKLYLWQTKVTPDGVADLQKRQPKLEIVLGTTMGNRNENQQASVAKLK